MAKSHQLPQAQDLACLSWEAERVEVGRRLEAARQEAEFAATARREAEQVRRERDPAIESSRHGWQALRDAEAARDRGHEEAARIALRVPKLEAAFSGQEAMHSQDVQALTLEHDTLRSQVAEVREGMSQEGPFGSSGCGIGIFKHSAFVRPQVIDPRSR